MALDLSKAVGRVKLNLSKLAIAVKPMQIGFASDVSGSMQSLYARGNDSTMQDVLTNIYAVAKVFDDNGQMELWAFDEFPTRLPDVNEENQATYIPKHVTKLVGGGTYYAPTISAIGQHYAGNTSPVEVPNKEPGFFGKLFGAKKAEPVVIVSSESVEQLPTMVFFLTDGESRDISQAIAAIKANNPKKIYWQLIGIGRADFSGLQRMGDELDNAGFVHISDISQSAETLHQQIFTPEVATWLSNQ